MSDIEEVSLENKQSLIFATKSPKHRKYKLINTYLKNNDYNNTDDTDDDDDIINFMKQFNKDIMNLNSQFKSAIDLYKDIYNDAIEKSKNLKDFDISEFNSLETSKKLYKKYNKIIEKTTSPDKLKYIIENNKLRKEKYRTMIDEVSTEMMSDSVSNMVDDMKQLIVFTNQLNELYTDNKINVV
jgi:hypothetical protein